MVNVVIKIVQPYNVIIFWRMHVRSLKTTVSTGHFLIEIMFIL